ncbi:MAG: starch-binding protein [Muribaculaceae bacterium]|nr:starch-binding protein [Muribaculaceae bacterium]
MINRFLTYFIAVIAVLFVGCSDPFDVPPVSEIGSDGTVTLTFDIPAVTKHLSRATEVDPEFEVSDVSLLVYNGSSENVSASQSALITVDGPNSGSDKLEYIGNNQYRLSFKLKQSLRQESDLRFVFIANSPVTIPSDATYTQLKEITPTTVGVSGAYVMCGEASMPDILGGNTVTLRRNAAKVSVASADETPLSYPFALFGDATSSSVLAAVNGSTGESVAPSSYPDDVTDSAARVFHPTANGESAGLIGGQCFLIIKAPFQGTEYFYRLDFVRNDDDGNPQYISPLSNHWYQFLITEITAPGSSSPAEAVLHPANGVEYEIHDHSPVSFNMTSDGFRELGVSHTLEYTGNVTPDGSWSDMELYIKLFSKNATELPPVTGVAALVAVADPSWLELSAPEVVNDPDIVGADRDSGDHNDPGVVYRLKLRFNQSSMIGTLYNKITVKWLGLEREIPVVWIREFDGSAVTSAALEIKYGGTDNISDYWAFLRSTDDPENLEYPAGNLWGIQPAANNGKVRNQGFHFPVMYGSGTSYAQYKYTLTFDKGKFENLTGYTSEVTVSGDVAGVTHSESSGYPLTVTLERPGRIGMSDYGYTTGSLNVKISFSDGTSETYSFDLYHTGFFHRDNQTHRMDEQDRLNYYYYEVVPVLIDGRRRYILDRNLAAKSAEMYVRDSDGSTAMGNPAAAGGYFIVAYQQRENNGANSYKDPVMFDDTTDRVSPPGYMVPQKSAWDGLRISTSFHTEAVGRYFPAYYDTGVPTIGNVYFPKSMMMVNGAMTGESRSGYYWTSTAATGTEKEEIGKWLDMFVLTGSSTSFSNGCVWLDNNPVAAYGASVRCINIASDQSEVKRTSFNVSGATNIFLYTETDGQRTSTTTWPGHAIGNYATMSEGRWFGFSYESAQFYPEDLYVIFNFVDKDGTIYTYSQDETGATQYTKDIAPSQCYGWKVVGDTNPAIVPSQGYTTVDGVGLLPAEVTELQNWWRCGEDASGKGFVYDYKDGLKFRIFWPEWKTQTFYVNFNGKNIYKASGGNTGHVFGWNSYTMSAGEFSLIYQAGYDGFSPIANGALNTIFTTTDLINSAYINNNNVLVPHTEPEDLRVVNDRINPIPSGYRRIYMVNNSKWNNPHLWYWRRQNGSDYSYGNTWPGPAMIGVTDCDNWLWYYDIPDDANWIIYHNQGGTGNSGDTQLTEGLLSETFYN